MDRKAEHEKLLARILCSVEFPPRQKFLPFDWAGSRFDLITDRDTLLEAFSLRFTAYTRCRYIDAEDFPLGQEFDEHEPVSVHFLARESASDEPSGYARLILDTRSRMQIDHILDIADYRKHFRGRLCEMSRLISWPEQRPGVSRGLRYAAFRWAQMHGIAQIVGVSREEDRPDFDRRRFFPMVPYRRSEYAGSHFGPLRGQMLYGNVFDVGANREHIESLLQPPATGTSTKPDPRER